MFLIQLNKILQLLIFLAFYKKKKQKKWRKLTANKKKCEFIASGSFNGFSVKNITWTFTTFSTSRQRMGYEICMSRNQKLKHTRRHISVIHGNNFQLSYVPKEYWRSRYIYICLYIQALFSFSRRDFSRFGNCIPVQVHGQAENRNLEGWISKQLTFNRKKKKV